MQHEGIVSTRLLAIMSVQQILEDEALIYRVTTYMAFATLTASLPSRVFHDSTLIQSFSRYSYMIIFSVYQKTFACFLCV